MTASQTLPLSGVDLFCRVIDHYGDAGTAWRLARELRGVLGEECSIRLITDAQEPVVALAGGIVPGRVEILPWTDPFTQSGEAAPLIVELFGCDVPTCCTDHGGGEKRLIINLEYFSCEDWALDFHLRESLLGHPDIRKFFFMPGLDPESGGIMSFSRPQLGGEECIAARTQWLESRFLHPDLAAMNWLPVYAYRGEWSGLLECLSGEDQNWLVWALGDSVQSQLRCAGSGWALRDFGAGCMGAVRGNCTLLYPSFMPQCDFDFLLAAADFSLVRGEDSLAGALLSGKPFLWQLYPQPDDVRRMKMNAFLRTIDPVWESGDLRALFSGSMERFNFPQKGEEVDWRALLSMRREMGIRLADFSSRLRGSCNLTEKLVQFVSFFFRGEMT